MPSVRSALRLLTALTIVSLFSIAAQAQGVIRFIASYGNDANPCTRTQPCRSMQAGVNATPDGSELQVLDSGGYGPNVTITKSITISGDGVSATVATPSGDGITINASGKTVALRGLLITGVGTGTIGINMIAATAVHIERCEIERFTSDGVLYAASGSLSVKDSVSRNNGGVGLRIGAPTLTAKASIDRSQFVANANNGVDIQGGVTITKEVSMTNVISASNTISGLFVDGGAHVNISNSTAAGNGLAGFEVGSFLAQLNISHSVARGNNRGMAVSGVGTMLVTDSVSTNNNFGIITIGTFLSRSANNNSGAPGTNTVRGNTTNVQGAIDYYNGN